MMAEEASTSVGPVGATLTQMSLQDKAASNIVSVTVAGNRVGNAALIKVIPVLLLGVPQLELHEIAKNCMSQL